MEYPKTMRSIIDKYFMRIDIESIKKEGLTIKEFLDLKYLYSAKLEIDSQFVENYGKLNIGDIEKYEDLGYIKTTIVDNMIKYEFREKIRDLFEGDKDLFLTFLSTFPIKTPSKRYLSTSDENTIMGKRLRKKWDKLFKNNDVAARKAIKVLEAEMDWRRRTGNFEYMQNAETWLNQGNFEKYEYLLEEKEKMDSKTREDYE